jgi:trigger factor
MSVVVAMKEVGPWRQELTIEVPVPAVEQETERVTRELARSVRLPGFRKGKVPADVVRKRFATDIRREVLDRLVSRFWQEAQHEKQLDLLLPPEVTEVSDLAPGQPLKFVATVETRPEIQLTGLSGFDLPEPAIEPEEQEVREALEDLRRRIADWKPVERPAGRGDRVAAEITEPAGSAEGEPKVDPVRFEVGDERVWEELTLAVTGLAPGQAARFSRQVQEVEGEGGARERHFEVRVTQVEERELPPLDDAFAEKLGGFANLAELEGDVRARLARQKSLVRREEREKALLDQLRLRHPLSLPEGVVDHEVEHLLSDYATSLAGGGVDLDQTGIDWRKLREEVRPQAQRRVHARLLLDAVADHEKIAVSDGEVEEALAVLARSQNTNVPTLRRALERDGRLEGFRKQLRRNKAVRRLLDEEPSGPDPLAATLVEPGPES